MTEQWFIVPISAGGRTRTKKLFTAVHGLSMKVP